MNNENYRSVKDIIKSIQTVEGAGFVVRRPFPTQNLDFFDPFLLLDHMGPFDVKPNSPGAPDHPHRGFETVTYLLEGKAEHKDSVGNKGVLNTGDVQWMTAGSGVIHSEMPEEEFRKKGGRMHGFQLWVNLPASKKMISPRYQDVPSEKIPVYENGNTRVKIIAGEAYGKKAVVQTHTPITYLHFSMKSGAESEQNIPANNNTLVYIISGTGKFGKENVNGEEGKMISFNNDGEIVSFKAESDLEFLLLSGLPLNEPVARYGPFVMNTREEIYQAFKDYESGKMGLITI